MPVKFKSTNNNSLRVQKLSLEIKDIAFNIQA